MPNGWACFLVLTITACGNALAQNNSLPVDSPNTSLTCKLGTAGFAQRKAGIIADLKSRLLERLETEKGYKFRFVYTAEMLDLLTTFIQSERECCDFFHFQLTVPSEGGVWLEIYGPKGAKEFIREEIGL